MIWGAAYSLWMYKRVYLGEPGNQHVKELTDIGAVLTNPVALAQFPHTIFASIMFAAVVLVAVAAYHLSKNQYPK